jgi:serine protease Do
MLSGIQEGDVIIEFNGELITNPANLKNVVSLTAPQNNSRVKIIRDGAQQIVQVVLQELPKNPQQYSNQRKMKLDRFGFELKKINHNLREKYNLSSDNALVITQIDPDSEAFEKGIREGDIIKRVGTEKVLTISDFERMANSSQNNGAILILVKKPNGKSRFFTLNY